MGKTTLIKNPLAIFLWLGLALGFVSLTHVRTHTSEKPPIALTGHQAKTQHLDPKQPVILTGTVDRITQNPKGQATIKLQSDDGPDLLISVPPTVSLQFPNPGTRVELTTHQQEPGKYTLTRSKDLHLLSQIWTTPAQIRIVANPRQEAQPGERVKVLAHLSMGALRPSNVYVGVIRNAGNTLGPALLPAQVAKTYPNYQDQELLLTGQLTPDGMFRIESLQEPIYD